MTSLSEQTKKSEPSQHQSELGGFCETANIVNCKTMMNTFPGIIPSRARDTMVGNEFWDESKTDMSLRSLKGGNTGRHTSNQAQRQTCLPSRALRVDMPFKDRPTSNQALSWDVHSKKDMSILLAIGSIFGK
ncbi:hypothetical protein B0H13DRAFT_1851207 [Mycena leptocephala]|nr:hypothetical protein B0H13DRAFT_1851207 [Mycena leptocephala]